MKYLQSKKYLLIGATILLAVIWLLFLRDYSKRVDQNESATLFTTKIEEIEEVDCQAVGELLDDAFCLEIRFEDPTIGETVKSDVNGIATFSNFASTLEVGDLIRVSKTELTNIAPALEEGEKVVEESLDTIYIINGFDRINSYFLMISIFILVVITFTGLKGVKSLISLGVSLLIIVYVIVPLTIKGYNPILVSAVIGFIMFSILILITNGINKLSYLSISGASVGIMATILFTFAFTAMTNLSGMGEEETGVLASVLDIDIDIIGIVMASFILGVLGVVDDASVSQVYTVAELRRSNPDEKPTEIYKSAMRVGSSHIGSLINTLLLAYVASSFALFILMSMREQNIIDLLSADLLAEEIVRTLVGSLGLVLTIPATTFLASRFLKLKDVRDLEHGHTH